MAVRLQQNVAYGLSDALLNVPLLPVVANRAPTSRDRAALGTIWVYADQNIAYILTSITNNQAEWVNISQAAADFVTYNVQTNDGVATAIATFNPPLSSAINIAGNIIAAKSDFTEAVGGRFTGSFRRPAVGQPVVIGAPVIEIVKSAGAAAADVNIVVAGNSVVVTVTGINPDVWNWRANITTDIIP